ncbi:MAG: efflux RND transporter periplasmic adaptor subunit, partial [bacterium]|nr:efflux RND transporter periplasmic adaptor subunit [bacterium]
LQQKIIMIGLNNDASVKVIKGLSPKDDVITNAITNGENNNTNNAQKSPFMPQMPGRRSTGGSRN